MELNRIENSTNNTIYDRFRNGKEKVATMIWGDGVDNWL
jgi:hypothetical protein